MAAVLPREVHPPVRDEQAAIAAATAVLARDYGLRADTVTRLGGELDLNLAVTSGARRVVVKLGPPQTDTSRLRWQHNLLASLHTATELPPLPEVLRTHDGRDVVPVDLDGQPCPLRVQTWLAGRTLAELGRHSPALLRDWGRAAAQLVRAMPTDVSPDDRPATHHWEVLRAPDAVAAMLPAVTDAGHRRDVEILLARFDDVVPAAVPHLPHQVVHQDLNDFNVLAAPDKSGAHRLSGVLDFTDALYTARVSELAVAVAYAMLRKSDPLRAAADVVAGFTELVALTDAELRVVFPLAAARLCVNATTWTARAPDNGEYAQERMAHTWPTIRLLAATPPALAEHWFRHAAGEPAPVVEPPPVRNHVAVGGGHLQPAVTGPRRRRDGTPATVRLGAEVAAVDVPAGGQVELDTGDVLIVRYGQLWVRWCRRSDGTARLAVFTDATTARVAPRDVVPWTSVAAWSRISPDPRVLTGVAPAPAAAPVAVRDRHVARSQRHYYAEPPVLVASDDVWLHDRHGLGYLDTINNVSHVGHANPAVVAALSAQAARLNTNSRFVYDGLPELAQRLAHLLPDPLEVVFFAGSGSEANDLALRIVRQVTGRRDVAVIDGAYHGNTEAVTAISPNRYRGPGGAGRPDCTHELPLPDRYRGRYGYDDPDAGVRYAADAARLIASAPPLAAVFAESLLGTAGCIGHPPGYLAGVFDAVRATGGLCVSDEVQVGFGRLGDAFWGFETNGVVPDVVTMGKPMGNGHPLAAVVTTRAIADAFDTGMKYFNTFGGNPVSCAVGMAVLDEIEQRGLQAHAGDVGAYLLGRLRELAMHQPLVGDVRGHGLYLGVELVRDRGSREPATTEARAVCELLLDDGVISYPTGVHDNVLKIKPPMTFTRTHADLFCEALDDALSVDR